MQEIIKWINSNESITNILLSVISLIIGFIAIIISVVTARMQNKIDLFEKRYEVYSRFSELFQAAENISHPSLTLKGKMMFFNSAFGGIGTESSKIGCEILKIDEELSNSNLCDEKRKILMDKKSNKLREKNVLDYAMLAKDETLLGKYKLLFDDNVNKHLESFFKIYSDIVMSANFTVPNIMEKLFEQWNETCVNLREENFIEKMQERLNIREHRPGVPLIKRRH